jgi:hypothetical protein
MASDAQRERALTKYPIVFLTLRTVRHIVPREESLARSILSSSRISPAQTEANSYIIWSILTVQQTPQTDLLKQQLRDSLLRETRRFRPVKFAKHENVYNSGDEDHMVYVIESGQIKLVTLSPDGKECLLAIYSAGDVFGELCLADLGPRNYSEPCHQKILRVLAGLPT